MVSFAETHMKRGFQTVLSCNLRWNFTGTQIHLNPQKSNIPLRCYFCSDTIHGTFKNLRIQLVSVKNELLEVLETEEQNTVSNSFGGAKIDGRTPSFSVRRITTSVEQSTVNHANNDVSLQINRLSSKFNPAELRYAIGAVIRFSFLIELTNLKITSTKMKTRWFPGQITKTQPGTFTNYPGDFAPGSDPRSSSFDECYRIFLKVLTDLFNSDDHINAVKKLTQGNNRRVPYEFVFTYIDVNLNTVHTENNIRLVSLDDISWLISARNQIRATLPNTSSNKIKTKAYLTDRAQTGTDQTNRAKRWEILSTDFQFATLEQCWSVEKKLLSDLAHFRDFPTEVRESLIQLTLFEQRNGFTRCPITLLELEYNKFIQGPIHGESQFQVGHLKPLKVGGSHSGDNVAWITNDGNRIQGDLELHEVRELLSGIVNRMNELNVEGED